jgi:hypothetical protein
MSRNGESIGPVSECLAVRRGLLQGEPQDAVARRHIADCPGCSATARRLAEENHRVRRAIAVSVPEDIAAGILMAQGFAARRQRRRRLLVGGAMAASLVLLAVTLVLPQVRAQRLGNELLEIIATADYALESSRPLAVDRVRSGLASAGIALQREPEHVSFAGPCLIGGVVAGHLVLREQEGPITVLMIPGGTLPRRIAFEDDTWSGVAIPGDQGLLALIGPRGADTGHLVRRLTDRVRWQRLLAPSRRPPAAATAG